MTANEFTGSGDSQQRVLTEADRRTIRTAPNTVRHVKELLESVKKGDTFLEDYTEEVQEIIKQLLPPQK